MYLPRIFLFFFAFFLALGFTPLVRGLARQGIRQKPIPRLGGAAIFLAFILPLFPLLVKHGAFPSQAALGPILFGSVLVLAIGAYDDIRGASVWSRLAVEIAAASLVYSAGIRIDALPNPFGAPLPLGWLGLPATVLWIVVITNAVNLVDGLDGLASGTSVLILLTILLLNLGRLDSLMVTSVLSLLGALVGFLFFNFPPASIYMGDSGSLFIGFFLSSFSITAAKGSSGMRFIAIAALAFSLPLLDMAYAVLRRWYRGVPIYRADKDHLHHKLLQKGLSKRQVVLLFYCANLVLMLALIVLIKVNSRPLLKSAILLALSLAAFAALQFLSDLRPGDFIAKVISLFRSFRRRRYHLYLINRFEHQVEKKEGLPEILPHLDQLFAEYGVQMAEVLEGKGGSIYRYGSTPDACEAIVHEFPIIRNGACLGRVVLKKKQGGAHLVCTGELSEVLSETLGRALAR